MNMKTRIAKFLITLASFSMMTSVNAYQGSDCCVPCGCGFDPCCPTPNRSFYAQADFIYWGAHLDGLRFAQSGFGLDCCEERTHTCDFNGSCSGGNSCDGRCRDHDFDWNPGFKVGAGMVNPCCDWELFVQYTYYYANPKKRVHKGRCDLFPYWGWFHDFVQNDDLVTLSSAFSRYKLNFNALDALVTNEFCVNNCFTFRPSFGLKAGWHRHRYEVIANLEQIDNTPDVYVTKHKQDFWGVGPKFGMTASASLYDCISLYGNIGLSTLYGEYQVCRNDVGIDEAVGAMPADTRGVVCTRHCRYRVTPVWETSFGLRYDTDLCCGDYGFYVHVAWEQQIWFQHNDFINIDVNHAQGNLTLQGVTAGVGFSF
jgi:Legionella pneumophila major outer membrane protein precursor